MANENLEKRIAKLESLIMNESLSETISDDMIENLSEMNKSNRLDSDNFRWSSAMNLLSNLIDTMLDDESAEADSKEIARLYKSLEKAGYESGAALISEMIAALDRRMEDLKEAKTNLNNVLKSAKKFDKANK